jgi:hypothetical protein
MELAIDHQFKLSTDTEKRLNQLEKIIEKGMAHFVEVGTALLIIQKEKLYKLIFQTFEEYCKERWDLKRQRAYELIGAAQISQNLSEIYDNLPKKESHAAALASLEPEQQKEAWKKTIETAPEGRVTARHVEKVVQEMTPETKTEIVSDLDEEPEEIEDTPVLKQLKKYWEMADLYEKETFLDWIGAIYQRRIK